MELGAVVCAIGIAHRGPELENRFLAVFVGGIEHGGVILLQAVALHVVKADTAFSSHSFFREGSS